VLLRLHDERLAMEAEGPPRSISLDTLKSVSI
jgi:hypothetical protein